jgi:hypothetical protein
MTSNHDEPRLSSEDERFVRRLDALYQPPEPTAAVRARFAARLHERMARRRARARWQLAGATAAVAVLALVVARLPGVTSGSRDASDTALASAGEPSAEETLLFLANGPLADPDEALPDDYRTLASLLE